MGTFGGTGPFITRKPLCQIGRTGWLGRLVRDTHQASTRPGYTWLVMGPAIAVASAGAIAVRPHAPPYQLMIAVVVGVFVGTGAGWFLVALLSLLTDGRRRHWEARAGRYGGDVDPSKVGHSLLSLHTLCRHGVWEAKCAVTDPGGVRRWAPVDPGRALEPRTLSPPEYLTVSYPKDFDAPWPEPGTYHIKWTMRLEGRKRRITVRRMRWEVVEDPPLAV